ncbi:MFS transporter [Streptomyces sp. NPDC004457]
MSGGPVRAAARAGGRTRERLPRAVWLLVATVFVSSLCAAAIAPVLTVRAAQLTADTAAVPAVVSAYFLARLVLTPVAGRFVTTGHARLALPAGLLLTAVSTAAVGQATGYGQLLLLRVVGGVGSTLFTVSAVAVLVAAAPDTLRGRAFGVWSVGFEVGSVLGPLVGAGLLAVARDAPFTVAGGCLAVAALAAARLLRPARPSGDAPGTGAGQRVVGLRHVLAHRTYRAALVSNFAVGWGAYGVPVSLLPLYAQARFAHAGTLASLCLTAFAVGNAIVLPVAGRLTDARGRRPVALTGLAMSVAGLAGIGFSGGPLPLLTAAVLTGLGCGATAPAHGAAVADVVGPDARGGSALAAFQLVADTGAVVGPVLAGLTAATVSYPAAFILTAAVPATAFAAWLRAPETRPARLTSA